MPIKDEQVKPALKPQRQTIFILIQEHPFGDVSLKPVRALVYGQLAVVRIEQDNWTGCA